MSDIVLIDEEEGADDEFCAYVSEDGTRCRNHARPGSRFCGIHQEGQEEAGQE